MKLRIKKIVSLLLVLLSSLMLSLIFYVKNVFGDAKFEQLLYSLKYATGTSVDVVIDVIKYCVPIVLIFCLVYFFWALINYEKSIHLNINFKKLRKNFSFQLFPLKKYLLISIGLFFSVFIYGTISIGFWDYVSNIFEKTTIYENYYVNPKNVEIIFPKKKQNLIYIFLESMESNFSNFIIDQQEVNLIPNLTKLVDENISFSHYDGIGGAYTIMGATYTVAAMVAQTAGIPLRTILVPNEYENYSSFLPGVTSLGEILEQEDYRQILLIGSNSEFAGRDDYFREHGNYDIYDYRWAKENAKITMDYSVDWGYEDKKLFSFAQEILEDISKDEKPFNLTLLTTGTHAVDGFIDDSCDNLYSYPYGNAILCSDYLVESFINWVEKQDFYKDTTIVLIGDHMSMQTNVEDYLKDSSNRYMYNVFINSRVSPYNTQFREFTSFDLFPTTLASLGVNIEGNKLGLGVNLFSEEKTLVEEVGFSYLNEEVQKNSSYYNDNFLGETYYEMLVEVVDDEEIK